MSRKKHHKNRAEKPAETAQTAEETVTGQESGAQEEAQIAEKPAPAQEEKKPQEEKAATEVVAESKSTADPSPAADTADQAEADAVAKTKPGKKKKWPVIAAAVLLAGAVGAGGIYYGLQVSKYQECFFEGTFINGVDCSNLTVDAAAALLDGRLSDYSLEVWGRNPQNPGESGIIGTIRQADVNLRRGDTDRLVAEVLGQQDAYKWYEMYLQDSRRYEFDQEILFDETLLGELTGTWDACGTEKTLEPVNAYISDYLPAENAYRVLPETMGSRMDSTKILPAISSALVAMEPQVDIENTGCYSTAKVKADDHKLNETVSVVNKWLGSEITYDWYGTEVQIGSKELQQWVSLDQGKPVLDEEAVAAFIKEKAKEADPNGNTYTFTTTLGSQLELKCKSGWTTDCEKETEELIALILEGESAQRTPVSSTVNYVQFNGGVGDSFVEIDLTNQHLYLYNKGELIVETDFVSGDLATGHRTPEGIYAVTYKTRDRILRGPGYASFVYYWMPFYGGYGMHDATWRSVFGGQIYKTNGSHGCINMPLSVAPTVYGYMQTGYPVVCYYYPEGENPADLLKQTDENGELLPEEPEPVEENVIQGQW